MNEPPPDELLLFLEELDRLVTLHNEAVDEMERLQRGARRGRIVVYAMFAFVGLLTAWSAYRLALYPSWWRVIATASYAPAWWFGFRARRSNRRMLAQQVPPRLPPVNCRF